MDCLDVSTLIMEREKYINTTNFLEESLVLNVKFDPFNLSKEVNENAYRYRESLRHVHYCECAECYQRRISSA